MKPALLLLTLLNITLWSPAEAQRKLSEKPAFILVELYSYRDKIRNMEGDGNSAAAQQLREEADLVARLTRRDFGQNFPYCPVYFFADTNSARIYAHQYEGLLTDARGQPVTALPDAADTTHLVAYYNLFAANSMDVDGSRVVNGPYLNLLSHRGGLFRPGRLRFVRGNLREYRRQQRSDPGNPIGFRSQRFAFLQYLPVAKRLQQELTGYLGK